MNSANPEFLDDDSDDSSLASNPTRKDGGPHTHGNRDFSLAPSPAPASIGRYKIIRTLGSGGFGTVYLGTDSRLNRQVAIKVSNRVKSNSDESERFLTEARAIAALNHPNIIQIYDADRDERGYFVVMEYVKGTTLALEHQQSTQLPIGRIIPIIKQVVLALGHVHERGMVHRDVKPSNVLIAPDNLVKVSDFGLALTEDSPAWGTKERAGTFRYMAPEQVLGENHRLDGRTDLWAVGVMFYELVCGRSPFTAHDANQLFKKILAGEVRPLRQRRPDIPPMLEYICTRCLSKCMADRYQSAIELHEELVKFETSFAGQGVTSSPVEHVDAISNIPSAKVPSASNVSSSRKGEIKIVPKGLRSFDLEDASFFRKLLPGPYDIDDNSPSLLYWLKWIRDEEPNAWNRVGLIYGPSGCGKSSFLKAGLIPSLPPHVTTCYFDFTSTDPIKALQNKLVSVFPECKGKKDLSEMFSTIRRHDSKRTVLLVFDQFEQYLVQADLTLDLEIVQALRQCNGKNLRALVLVRDEFWSHASRCMRLIESPLSDEKNAMNIPLFDRRHASRVLEAFGRAYQVLPESPAPLTESQKEFIDQAIEGLAEDKQVICVRIAIFAELMRGYEWTPQSLTEIGGAEGVAVRFLHDALESKNAPMSRRTYLEPCHELLRAILPDADIELKASSKSKSEWLESAGLDHSYDVEEAIKVLVHDLRLITASSNSKENESSYHLTHDYLVRPLRIWLADSDRMTWRGRARLKLRELSTSFERTGSPRHLPSLSEWGAITLAVPRKARLASESKLMARANAKVALRGGIFVLFMAIFVGSLGTAIQRSKAAYIILVEKVNSQLQASLSVESSELRERLQELGKSKKIAQEQVVLIPVTDSKKTEKRRILARSFMDIETDLSQVATVLPDCDAIELMLWYQRLKATQKYEELGKLAWKTPNSPLTIPVAFMGLVDGNPKSLDLIKNSQEADDMAFQLINFSIDRLEVFDNAEAVDRLLRLETTSTDPVTCYVVNSILGALTNPILLDRIKSQKAALQKNLEKEKLLIASSTQWLLNRVGESTDLPNLPFDVKRDWYVIEPVSGCRIVMGALNSSRSSWISQCEINSELFRLFGEEMDSPQKDKHAMSSLIAANEVNSIDAAEFCNWLSNKLELESAYRFSDVDVSEEGWVQIPLLSRTVVAKTDGNTGNQERVENLWYSPNSHGVRLPSLDELKSLARVELQNMPRLKKTSRLLRLLANFSFEEQDRNRLRDIGESMPNPLGFYDVMGNVGELFFDPKSTEVKTWISCFDVTPKFDGQIDREVVNLGGFRHKQTGIRIAMKRAN